MEEFSGIVTCVGVACAFLIAAGQLVRGFSSRNLILATFFLFVGGAQLTSAFLFDGRMNGIPELLVLHVILAMSAGPLLFLFLKSLMQLELRINRSISFHFAVPLLVGAFVLFKFIFNPQQTRVWIKEFHSQDFGLLRLFSVAAGVNTVAYLIYLVGKLVSIWNPEQTRAQRRSLIGGLLLVALATTVGITGAIVFHFYLAITIALALLVVGYYLVAQRFPFLLNQGSDADRARLTRSLIQGIDLNKLAGQLHQLMDVEKLFCDEDLSLPRLAAALEISTHQLSEYLNQQRGKNFATYVNEFRVQEARAMLCETERTTLSISLAVGFNSHSAFHEAFVKFVGVSPGRFRRAQLSDL